MGSIGRSQSTRQSVQTSRYRDGVSDNFLDGIDTRNGSRGRSRNRKGSTHSSSQSPNNNRYCTMKDIEKLTSAIDIFVKDFKSLKVTNGHRVVDKVQRIGGASTTNAKHAPQK